jgi:hypothetical protein
MVQTQFVLPCGCGEIFEERIEAACGKLRQVRFRWRGGGSCTVEDTVCATVGREVFVLSKFNGK